MELFDIALGKHRNARNWKNVKKSWPEIVDLCRETHYTPETLNEYLSFHKSRQDEIKDVSGFVTGYLVGGRRKKESVLHKQILALDADFAEAGLDENVELTLGCAAILYTTHKHTPEKNRFRLLIPIDRPATPEEYEPLCRKVTGLLGIEQFDHTTYDLNRLMYLPSTSKGAEYVFKELTGEPLSVDNTLALYTDWHDASEWPVSDRETRQVFNSIMKQGDPLEKEGIVGQYCRTYSIQDAITKELNGVYEQSAESDRFTYLEGSTAGGAICYEDKFLYSHHGTDPISGTLRNAFDLVRIHKFGFKDEDAKPDTPTNRLPSFVAMMQHAEKDPEVRRTRDAEKLAEAGLDFADSTIDWMALLDADKRNNYETSVKNIRLILENDELLKGKFGLNEFSYRMEVLGRLPWNPEKKVRAWSDEDWSGLRCYLGEAPYNLQRTPKLEDVVDGIVKRKNSFHPILDYLGTLNWDGVERIDTLFINYLGAADNEYVRAVTRKALIACVARVKEPGIKFDNVVTLVGKQGTGKSTIIKKLGREWFSDNFSFHMLSGGNGKQAQEQIQGVWILEIGEMAGLRKAEAEAAKSFLSAQKDEFRPSHGREKVIRPRQVVPFGTSNDKGLLKAAAGGNRRIWPVDIHETRPVLSVWDDLTDKVVSQVWAEALEYYREGEALHLPEHIEELANSEQESHIEVDDREGIIQEFLATKLPEDWADMDVQERRNYLKYPGDRQGNFYRSRVTAAEIWCEVFEKNQGDMNAHTTRFIHDTIRKTPGWEVAKTRGYFKIYGKQTEYLYSGKENLELRRSFKNSETVKVQDSKTENLVKDFDL